MLLVKTLAENIDMELLITLEEFSSHTINAFSISYHECQIGDDSLFCRRGLSNEYDEYSAAIVAIDHFKQKEVVGYVSFFLSKTLNKLLNLPGLCASFKVTGTGINKGIGVGLEIPIETTFVLKEMATEWLKTALYCINMMIERKVQKCKKPNNFFQN